MGSRLRTGQGSLDILTILTLLSQPYWCSEAMIDFKPHNSWQLIPEGEWFCFASLSDATQSLSFVLDHPNPELKESDSVTLVCEGDGNPPPKYTIFKSEVSLFSQTSFWFGSGVTASFHSCAWVAAFCRHQMGNNTPNDMGLHPQQSLNLCFLKGEKLTTSLGH